MSNFSPSKSSETRVPENFYSKTMIEPAANSKNHSAFSDTTFPITQSGRNKASTMMKSVNLRTLERLRSNAKNLKGLNTHFTSILLLATSKLRTMRRPRLHATRR